MLQKNKRLQKYPDKASKNEKASEKKRAGLEQKQRPQKHTERL